MAERTGFSREVCEAQEAMNQALERYVIGSRNLLRALVVTRASSLETFAKFDATLSQCIIQSNAQGPKRRFRGIMEDFNISVAEHARNMEVSFNSVERNPDLKLVRGVLG